MRAPGERDSVSPQESSELECGASVDSSRRPKAVQGEHDSVREPEASGATTDSPEDVEPHVAVTVNSDPVRAAGKRHSSAPPSRPNIAERYRLDERLAEGGMGIVYSAWHVTLDQPVAIKVIRRELINNAEAVQRFIEEARALAQLRGPHVAQVLDAGIADGSPFIVMELLRGRDLRTLLEGGQIEIEQAIQLVSEACDAVAEAHAKGIVHRDLKPENLFLAESENGGSILKVIDFGISARQGADGIYNHDSAGPGSPEYMAPEQLLPDSTVDHRADIWSLGVVLFELLSGRVPFGGQTQHEVCSGVVAGEPPPLRELRREVSPELEAVVLRCLSKSADERFPDAAELSRALREFELAGQSEALAAASLPPPDAPVSELALTYPPEPTRTPRVSRSTLGFALAAGCLVGALAYFGSRHTQRAHSTPPAGVSGDALARDVERPGGDDQGEGPVVTPVDGTPAVLPVLGEEATTSAPNARGASSRLPLGRAPSARGERETRRLDKALDNIGEEVSPLVTTAPASEEEVVEARYALAASEAADSEQATQHKQKTPAKPAPSSSAPAAPATAAFPDTTH